MKSRIVTIPTLFPFHHLSGVPMKCTLALTFVFYLGGCGRSNDPGSLISEIEAAAKAGADVTPDQVERAKDAAARLGRLGPAAVPAMIEGLGNSDMFVRDLLVRALAEIGAPGVAPLTAAIGDRNAHRRRGAIEALQGLALFKKVDIKSAVPALKSASTDSDALVRRAALGTLSVALADTGDSQLVAALKDTHPSVRVFAARSLAYLPGRPVPLEALPALMAALEDDDRHVQLFAATALGKLGPEAKAAAPRIARLLEDHGEKDGRNGFGGYEFANALVGIGPDAIVPLKDLLRSKKTDVRSRARRALETLGRSHPAALEALKHLPL